MFLFRYLKYFVLIGLHGLCFILYAQTEDSLVDAVKNYQTFQKDLNETLRSKTNDCSLSLRNNPDRLFCTVKDFCSLSGIHFEEAIIYQSNDGEIIQNEDYYADRNELRSCLKEKYADDIVLKKNDLNNQLMSNKYKKMLVANDLLNLLTKKYNQRIKIQKISSRIMSMAIEKGIAGGASSWDKENVSKSELGEVIARAEKKEKLLLNREVKKVLIEIQYLNEDRSYQNEVNDLDNKLFPEIKAKDPFSDWSLMTNEKAAGGKKELLKNQNKLLEKTQMAYGLFKETQSEMISYLETTKNEKNIESIERIIQRVKTIHFNPPRLTERLSGKCTQPNAYYNYSDHSFTICPQSLLNPKISLIETIAHEIAHSFDSCRNSGRMVKSRLPQIVEEAPFEIEISMDSNPVNYENTLFDDAENLNPKSIIQEKVKFADNPFIKTLSCLQDSKSLGVKTINPKDIKLLANIKLLELKNLGQEVATSKKAKIIDYFLKHQQDYFDYFQGCDHAENADTLLRSQLEEAFAEKISSEVMARKLSLLSKSDAQIKILELILSSGGVCTDKSKANINIEELKILEGCPRYFENMTEEKKILAAASLIDSRFDTHSEPAKNIDRVLLAHPEIRKVLNCPKDEGIKFCE